MQLEKISYFRSLRRDLKRVPDGFKSRVGQRFGVEGEGGGRLAIAVGLFSSGLFLSTLVANDFSERNPNDIVATWTLTLAFGKFG